VKVTDCNKCISRDECTDDEVNEAMKQVLQTKVLPALYRAKEYLKQDRYDSAYNEIEDAIAVIANRLLPELSLQDLDQIRVLALIDKELEKMEHALKREGFTITTYQKERIKKEIKKALNEWDSVVEHFNQLAEQDIPFCAPAGVICARFTRKLSDEEMKEAKLRSIFACRKVFEVYVTRRVVFAQTYIEHPDVIPVPKVVFEWRWW